MTEERLSDIAKLLSDPTNEEIEQLCADAARYRYLRDHCSSHYAMTWEQPAEWSIGWEFQQGTPAERYGSFDSWIDRDIATEKSASGRSMKRRLPNSKRRASLVDSVVE